MAQACRLALHYGEEHLGVTDIFGEDVGPPLGGVFTATQGLKTAWNSPLDERGIIGTAIGLGLAGQRPVAEVQFCDYIFNTVDLLKQAGMMTWTSNGQFACPIVIMTPVGSGIHGSIYHSHSFDATMTHFAGWKIVMPSRPIDLYGLMLSCIKDPNPCMMLIPKALIRTKGTELIPGEPSDENELKRMVDAPVGDRSQWRPQWPKVEGYFIPFGAAAKRFEGEQATVVSYGRTQVVCEKVVEKLKNQRGYSIDCIDMRSLIPYDWDMIRDSILKTRRVLFVNEDTEISNFGEHLYRRAVEECFYDLAVPPRLLAGAQVPGIGLAVPLEMASVPQEEHIERALIDLIEEPA
jgi:2-oxoisovalerate dehydrogenase E1 component beta subunit